METLSTNTVGLRQIEATLPRTARSIRQRDRGVNRPDSSTLGLEGPSAGRPELAQKTQCTMRQNSAIYLLSRETTTD